MIILSDAHFFIEGTLLESQVPIMSINPIDGAGDEPHKCDYFPDALIIADSHILSYILTLCSNII